MLRYDVPQVWSNVIRFEAFITFLLCLLSYFVVWWAISPLIIMGFIRGFIGHHKCPSHLLWRKIFEKLSCLGHKENAGAKMFANKILFIASSAVFILHSLGLSFWVVPCIALIIFSFAEWVFGFCAACWAYSLYYRFFST